MLIREYISSDCEQIAELFYQTVHTVNAKDYASNMSYSDNEFDTIVIYNAFFHFQSQWDMIERECKRVIKEMGKIYIIGTWSLDTNLMVDKFGDNAVWHDGFLIVEMTK